jgi:hypothetical protein
MLGIHDELIEQPVHERLSVLAKVGPGAVLIGIRESKNQ